MPTKFYDPAGNLYEATQIFFYDPVGDLKEVTEGWFYDPAGELRQFFAQPVTADESFFFPGTWLRDTSTAGQFLWTVPAGITRIHAFVVGGGGSGGLKSTSPKYAGGGGGGSAYSNNIVVTPGEVLRIVVGGGGVEKTGTSATTGNSGQTTYIQKVAGGTFLVQATGGGGGGGAAAAGGNGTINSGTGATAQGGVAGWLSNANVKGGGGAGGYGSFGGGGAGSPGDGNGGAGGSGGGGAAGSTATTGNSRGGMGGGTGVFGVGASGLAGVYDGGVNSPASNATSGSGGINPPLPYDSTATTRFGAGLYGGGGGSANMPSGNTGYSGRGGPGAVMIRWGAAPTFPTLWTPPQGVNDFVMTPATLSAFATAAAINTTNLSLEAVVVGTIAPNPPTLKQGISFSGLAHVTTDGYYYIILCGVPALITNLSSVFQRLTLDGLGFLDVANADAVIDSDYSAISGTQYVLFRTAGTLPLWTVGTPYTSRITY
jgi:hypothetical protein